MRGTAWLQGRDRAGRRQPPPPGARLGPSAGPSASERSEPTQAHPVLVTGGRFNRDKAKAGQAGLEEPLCGVRYVVLGEGRPEQTRLLTHLRAAGTGVR